MRKVVVPHMNLSGELIHHFLNNLLFCHTNSDKIIWGPFTNMNYLEPQHRNEYSRN